MWNATASTALSFFVCCRLEICRGAHSVCGLQTRVKCVKRRWRDHARRMYFVWAVRGAGRFLSFSMAVIAASACFVTCSVGGGVCGGAWILPVHPAYGPRTALAVPAVLRGPGAHLREPAAPGLRLLVVGGCAVLGLGPCRCRCWCVAAVVGPLLGWQHVVAIVEHGEPALHGVI